MPCWRAGYFPRRCRFARGGLRLVAFALLLPSCAFGALAASRPAPDLPTFELRLGGFLLTDLQTELRLSNAQDGTATLLDFERSLGGDTSLTVLRLDADWHFARSHLLQASWYDIDSRGHREISTTLSYGGTDFPFGTALESRFRTDIYKVSYGYFFYRGARHEFAALVGAHVLRAETSLQSLNTAHFARFAATAPLPAIGVGWMAQWSDRFSTRALVQYFGFSLDKGKVSGHFVDTLFAAEYRMGSSWGLGAGYNHFDLAVILRRDDARLAFTRSYHGLLAYAFVRF